MRIRTRRRTAAWALAGAAAAVGAMIAYRAAAADESVVDELQPRAVEAAARVALSQGADYLCSLADGEEAQNLVVLPHWAPDRITGYEQVEKRYRREPRRFRREPQRFRRVERRFREVEERFTRKTVKVPVYENEYDSHEELVVDRTGQSVDAREQVRRVTRRQYTGRKQVGTRDIVREVPDPHGLIRKTRLVRDPNGRIVKGYDLVPDPEGSIVKGDRLVPDPKGPVEQGYELVPDPEGDVVRQEMDVTKPIGDLGRETWPPHFLGRNAMALYVLRACGYAAEQKRVRRLADALCVRCRTYGLPDETWDLAWLTAALSLMSEQQCGELTRQLAGKLLDGQQKEGPARGLWGPVCVNTELLAAMIAYELELTDELKQRRELAAAEPKSRTRARRVQEAEDFLDKFQEFYRLVSTHGRRFAQIRQAYELRPEMGQRPVVMPGLPYDIYHVALADVESTALVLFALREAAQHGRLPESTPRPELFGHHTFPVRPERSESVLARAAHALAGRQRPDGSWDEGNVIMHTDDFKEVYDAPTEKAVSAIQTVPSAVTGRATAEAYGALIDAGRIVGLEKLLGRFKAQVLRGRHAMEGLVEAVLSDDVLDPANRGSFALRGVHLYYGGDSESGRDRWLRLAGQLLERQRAGGQWGGDQVDLASSSLMAFREALAEQAPPRPQFARRVYDSGRGGGDAVDGELVSTLHAMLFLLAGIRPPVAGEWLAEWTAHSRVLDRVVARLGAPEKTVLHSARITGGTPTSLVNSLPLVVMRGHGGGGAWTSTEQQRLSQYIEQGGLLFVMVDADRDGAAFIKQTIETLSGAVDGLTRAAVDQQTPVFEGLKQAPRLLGLVREDGQPAVLLVGIRDSQPRPASAISSAEAARVLHHLILGRVDPAVLAPDYPVTGSRPAGTEPDDDRAADEPESPASPGGLPLPRAAPTVQPAADEQW